MSEPNNKDDARPDVLIVGASARSAAQSAVRAGLRPICADAFADEDLRAVAEVLPVSSFPQDLTEAARRAPPCPWMYTGALENRPFIVEAISARRTLWGNPPESLALVRDPLQVQRLLHEASLPTAAVRAQSDPPPDDGTWLIKPVCGASGRGIKAWRGTASPTLKEPHFFQKRIDGLPCSAIFVATRDCAHLVGLSRQLIGDRGLNAARFSYCGSSGPIFFDEAITRQIEQTGDAVARWARLRGLFGIDLVFDGTAAVPIEINPRYTASVEIFEHAYPVALLDWHRRACARYADPGGSTTVDQFLDAQIQAMKDTSRPPKFVEKAILFADRSIVTPSLEHLASRRSAGLITLVADRPRVGTPIAAGRPICSLMVIGPDEDTCRQQFDGEVVALKQALSIGPAP